MTLSLKRALAPLLFVQARAIRGCAPVLPPAEGPREGVLRQGPARPLPVPIAGDSSSHVNFAALPPILPGEPVYRCCGATIAAHIARHLPLEKRR